MKQTDGGSDSFGISRLTGLERIAIEKVERPTIIKNDSKKKLNE